MAGVLGCYEHNNVGGRGLVVLTSEPLFSESTGSIVQHPRVKSIFKCTG